MTIAFQSQTLTLIVSVDTSKDSLNFHDLRG
jgi:hypothetical protein